MQNRIVFILFFSIVLALIAGGCESKDIYNEYRPLKVFGWNLNDTLSYEFEIMDIEKKYNMYLNVRHRDIFEYQNFYIQINTIFPNKSQKSEIISIPLSAEDGQWLGTCSGDICYISIPIFKRFRFKEKGKYQLKIKHEMRVNELKNLIDLGIKIVEAEKIKKEEIQ